MASKIFSRRGRGRPRFAASAHKRLQVVDALAVEALWSDDHLFHTARKLLVVLDQETTMRNVEPGVGRHRGVEHVTTCVEVRLHVLHGQVQQTNASHWPA